VKTLIIVGAGGHGLVCADIAEQTGRYEEIVFSDDRTFGQMVADRWLVKYRDADFATLSRDQFEFVIGIGQTGLGGQRQTLFEIITSMNVGSGTLCSVDAYVAESAAVGTGTVIGRMAIIQPNSRIGVNVIVNSRALIEHDAVVGDHCHISTGAILNGGARVGDRCLIGSAAVVLQGMTICNDVIVGAGAVVTNNIDRPGTYVGIPARSIHERRPA